MRFATFCFGAVLSGIGAFILWRRKEIVQDYVNANDRTSNIFKEISVRASWFGIFRFNTFEEFALVNTTAIGIIFLAMGALALAFLTYRLIRGF
jgi:hypothetical protein